MPIARRRRPSHTVGPDSELLIEGYPRSGNTFAETAFQLAQERPVKVATRLHAPAHVKAGIALGIPTLVLIRRPDDVVASWWMRQRGRIDLERLFRSYARFYEATGPFLGGLALASFDEVVTDFGAVIARVNQRFGVDFCEFEHTQENVARCFQVIESQNRRRNLGVVTEAGVSRPSEERSRVQDELLRGVLNSEPSGARARAHQVWRRLADRRKH